MAGVPSEKLMKLTGWPKGIANRAPETALPVDQDGNATSLRAAVNVDLTKEGKPGRRAGYVKRVSGTDVHSAWADPSFPFLLASTGNTLTAYGPELDATPLRSDLKPSRTLSYAEINGEVYWSNGFDCGKVTGALEDVPWGVENPGGTPIATASAAGGLTQGDYQVAVTFLTDAGEEGGSTLAALVTVAEGSGIALASIPQPTDPRVLTVRVYVSQPNGDVLYHAKDLPVGMTATTVGAGQRGKALETQWLSPLPAGQLLALYNGRLWVASGDTLWYSQAMRYGQCRRSRDFIRFNDQITLLLAPTDGPSGGLFVASGKRTYYLSGADPKAMSQVIAHPYGAVIGTGIKVPASIFQGDAQAEAAYWVDVEGSMMIGFAGGQVRAASDDYLAPVAESGTSLFRDINGLRQIVTNLRGTAANTARATDSLVATVERHGLPAN